MKGLIVALIFLLHARLAGAAPDLIQMAAEEETLTPALVKAVAQLRAGEINELRDADGRTALHLLAARSHQARALVVLLAAADVNARDLRGRTPLFEVIEAQDPVWKGESDFMLMEMLAVRGADVNARARDGSTPLALAVERGDYRKAEFLIWRGAAINPPDLPPAKSPWLIALAKNDARMKAMLAAALKPDSVPPASASPPRVARADRLSTALTAADLNSILGFLEANWNVNEQNEKGQTALFRAVEASRPDLVSLLLFEGADPDLADHDGKTPLMLGARLLGIEGQRMTAMLLLKNANVHATTKAGETALTIAAAAGHEIGVLWLLAAAADPLAPTPKGSVMEYVTHGRTMSVLAEFGVPQKARAAEPAADASPVAQMFEAAKRGDVAKVERMLQSGVPVDAMYDKERTALIWAVNSGHFDVVDLLLRHGADINKQYPTNGWHVLHYLVTWPEPPGNEVNLGSVYIAEIIQRGANPNLQMKDGTTPLMVAAKAGIKGMTTEALLAGGANLNLRNKEGLTALGIARKYGREEMAIFLKARGALE